jgi:hypothetical protein
VTGETGAGVATQVVWELLAAAIIERNGGEVTGADRQTARGAVAQLQTFGEQPREFRQRYLARLATLSALTRVVAVDDEGTEELALLRREARRVGVEVDGAYGRWAPAQPRVVSFPTPFTPTG